MKKILSFLTSFILAFSTVQVVFADGNGSMSNFKKTKNYTNGQFSDVSKNDWFEENVKLAYELGLINGRSDTTFDPDGEITYAETLALVCRIHNIYSGGTYKFNKTNPWYETYVKYNDKFCLIPFLLEPDEKMTRFTFAWAMMYAVPELDEINDIPDDAIPDVDDSCFQAYTLYRAGILTGKDKLGNFVPYSTVKRSEVATIITRVVDKSLRIKFKL